LLNRFF